MKSIIAPKLGKCQCCFHNFAFLGLVFLGARISAGTLMTKFVTCMHMTGNVKKEYLIHADHIYHKSNMFIA